MPRPQALAALLALAGVAAATFATIPDRIQGGAWYQEYLRQHPHLLTAAARAHTWDAPVDHFDPTSRATYKQRYFVDDRFFQPTPDEGGLVLLLIGGEGTLTGPPKGFLEDLASDFGALLVSLEHRFYGHSLPNGSIETDNYRYLTVEQALADVAGFSEYLRALYMGTPLRFFTVGGSYPGALSSFYRAAYPGSTLGSLSSSGVVHAILEFPAFDQHVAAAIGPQCADRVRAITEAFEEALAVPETAAFAKALFGADAGMWDPDFFYMLADSAAMADQYSNKSVLCRAIVEDLGPDPSPFALVVGFANFTNWYWGPAFGTSCFYDTRCAADTRVATLNERSWRWQKCSQLAYFQVAPQEGSLRSRQVTLDYHLEQCRRIFNLTAPPAVEAINKQFGGADPTATRVFYSNFGDDPWLEASVRGELDAYERPAEVAVYDGAGHCSDLHAPKPDDHPNLVKLRERFRGYLKEWVAPAPAAV